MALPTSIGDDRLVANDRGRRHSSGPPANQEEAFKPLRRRLEPARTGADQGNVEGKRYVGEPHGQDRPRLERRHLPDAAERSGYDCAELTLNWTKRGRVTWDGQPAQHWVSTERTLETECGMKVKTMALSDKRNRLPVKNLGDKPYAAVEYSEEYIKGGRVKTTDATAGDESTGLGPLRPSYEAKKRMQIMRGEMDGVRSLTLGGSNDDDKVISWEERTGMLTCEPDSPRDD